MTGAKKEYDLIFSLGGNCTTAHNLLYRNLRKFALPFDWTYIVDENALYNLAEGFKNGFADFMKLENLQELTEEEEKTVQHTDTYHYKDITTGFYYVNHFHKDIRTTDEYNKVKQIFDKRTKRLLKLIDEAETILMILGTEFYISEKALTDFKNSFEALYPNKKIEIVSLNFNCQTEEFIDKDNMHIKRYVRKVNQYDFTATNYEWAFLDNVKLTKKIRDKIVLKLFGYKIKITWGK